MSALQGQVDQWFTDNPNATSQQVVAAIQSVGGLNANAGLTDILASRYGVAPNEVQNYYNTYAAPAPAQAQAAAPAPAPAPAPVNLQTVANTSGLGSLGVGANNIAAPVTPPPAASAPVVYDQAYVNQLIQEAAQQAGGTLSYADVSNAADKLGISNNLLRGALPTGLITDVPLYAKLTDQSTPSQIAAAYEQFASGAGGDTDANKQEAVAYLRNLGIADPAIESAYKNYTVAPGLKSSFGLTDNATTPNTEGILSGFRYANEQGLDEGTMKQVLGEDVFNTYKTGFADYAKTGIANILADKKLSFDEARETVKFGRDYGYDAQKLADLTGTNKKVFDAIYKNYDDTTKRVVDGVLKADDVKTEGDQIERALALQKQYGFTDEDLAKAIDFSLDQVKGILDPVRNYEADYKKLLADPNRSDEQTKAFLTTALQNPFLKQKLGDKLQPALDELNRPPRERILSQIDQQRNVLGDKYYQGVFGNPEKIADVLEKKGVKSLADLGEKEKFRPTTAQAQYTSNGVPVQSPDGKNFYRTVDYGEGGTDYIPVDAKDVQTTYGKYVTEDGGGDSGPISVFEPLSEQEQATLKDGKYQERLGTVIVNKRTGEELTDTSHALAYQRSSGGLKEKKNYLTVRFDKNGNAVLTASKEKAGLGAAVQQALPVIAMALPFMLPGVGAALSGMLPGAGVAASGATAAIAPTLLNQALTQGIISGGLTTLGGGQFEKGFLGGAVSPVISSGIGSLLPTGMDPNIAKSITGAGTGVIKGALQGGDFEDLLKSGILSGVANYGLGEATKGLNLTPQQLNFATGIALPLLQGEKVSPLKVFGTATNYLASQQNQGKTP
jgi:molecular chaperone GrpE (heat shock protein)